MRADEAVKQLGQESGQERIARNRTHNLAWTSEFLVCFRGNDSRVEIDDPPLSREAVERFAVVHFARVHHDDVSGRCPYRSDTTPGTLPTGGDHAGAELIVGVAREVMVRYEHHRPNA